MNKVIQFGGRPVAAGVYLSALRTARQVANPALRDVLRRQVLAMVVSRINHHVPWYGRGKRWERNP